MAAVVALDKRPFVAYMFSFGDPSIGNGRRSIFDIVDQANRKRALERPALAAGQKEPPVSFLYMGLFLRFEKSGRVC